MRSSWASLALSSNKAFVVKEKFKKLKELLRCWNKEVFGVLHLNTYNVVKDINALDQILTETSDREVILRSREVTT